MSNPNDDPDVISGLCDDAQKEMATTPGPSHGDHNFEDEASPSPTSRTSASPASRTLAKADDEEPGLTVEAPAVPTQMALLLQAKLSTYGETNEGSLRRLEHERASLRPAASRPPGQPG